MSQQDSLREEWQAAAKLLGIEAYGPFPLELASGRRYEFSVFLPQFGAENGMLVHTEYDPEACSAAAKAGYGYSVFDPNTLTSEEADLDGYIDCLIDWGWVGQGLPPAWYQEDKKA